MKFNIIDKNNWNRVNTYNQFLKVTPCTYSMTVIIDVTKLYEKIKTNNMKFFPTILYGITSIVNRNKEFRMNIDSNGELGFYEKCNPCYTVFHKETETFTNVWTEYSEDYSVFLMNYLEDMKKFQNDYKNDKPIEDTNLFNVSSIPWTCFTGFNLNLQNGYDYFPPIFTIGKFYKEKEKLLLPLAIQVNHAVCDGFHVAKFVNELQLWAD